MTLPLIKGPCPECGDDLGLFKYETGWIRVECVVCIFVGSAGQSKLVAIREHNRRMAERAAVQEKAP